MDNVCIETRRVLPSGKLSRQRTYIVMQREAYERLHVGSRIFHKKHLYEVTNMLDLYGIRDIVKGRVEDAD